MRAFTLIQFKLSFGVTFMVETKKYWAFGLNILSEISLPEIAMIKNQYENPDVIIQIDDLSILWVSLAKHPYSFIIKKDFVMFQIPNVAIYLIEDGKKITVTPLVNANEDQIRLFILGTCIGALLMQRGILPLHGSAIEIDGRAYAIVGESGAGKSTLAAALMNSGYKLLSDDVIAVTISEEDHLPFIIPSYPQQKLWQESLDYFGMESAKLKPIYQRETKYTVPVSEKFFSAPLPLAGVFELDKGKYSQIEMVPIDILERLNTLLNHTYRNFLIPELNLVEWHFNYSTKILNKIDVFKLYRPTDTFTVYDLASLILNYAKKENTKNAVY